MHARTNSLLVLSVLSCTILVLEPGRSAAQLFKRSGEQHFADMSRLFKERADGRDYFFPEDMKNQFVNRMKDFLADKGVKDGKVTWELFVEYWEKTQIGEDTKIREMFRDHWKKHLDSLPKVPPRAGKLPNGLPDWFRKLDEDGDGQVSVFQWKKANRDLDEFLKMDRNDDGFLTADEVLRYLLATKLPAGLPDWFKKLDKDGDGRVSAFEWRTADRDVEEFFRMDQNDDGFLTPEEVLRFLDGGKGKKKKSTAKGG